MQTPDLDIVTETPDRGTWQRIKAGLVQMVYPWMGQARVAESALLPQRQALWEGLIDEHIVPSGLTLDMGCGEGLLTFHAARHGGRVIGIDDGAEAVARCEQQRQTEGLHNLRFVEGRLPDLDMEQLGGARLIICARLPGYVEDLDAALAALARLLKRNGTLLLSMPNLLSINRFYQRMSSRFTRTPADGDARHFTLPGLLGRRVGRYGLDLREVSYYDHQHRLANLSRKLRLPEPLTGDLFVAVFRKKG